MSTTEYLKNIGVNGKDMIILKSTWLTFKSKKIEIQPKRPLEEFNFFRSYTFEIIQDGEKFSNVKVAPNFKEVDTTKPFLALVDDFFKWVIIPFGY